jgi:hypothetical protein
MNRRQFVDLAAAGALALGLPGAKWSASPHTAVPAFARPCLLAILGEDRVLDIGRRYLEHFANPDIEARHRSVWARPYLEAPADPLQTGPGTDERLRQLVRDDFSAGRTVLIDGWVLSVTEARQCALFSILQP